MGQGSRSRPFSGLFNVDRKPAGSNLHDGALVPRAGVGVKPRAEAGGKTAGPCSQTGRYRSVDPGRRYLSGFCDPPNGVSESPLLL